MTDKPTGVFVRLPLDADQRDIVLEIAGRDCLTAALLAIGTPVTVGELEVVEYSEYEPEYHSEGMGCGLEDRGIHDRYEAMGYGWDQALDRACSEFPEAVLRSDAIAKLAEKEAEIARYREVISRIDGLIMGNNHPVKMFFAIHSACQAALKGPEA